MTVRPWYCKSFLTDIGRIPYAFNKHSYDFIRHVNNTNNNNTNIPDLYVYDWMCYSIKHDNF